VRFYRTIWYGFTALNPFVYSRPVEPGDLVDRDSEAEQLVALAEGGHAVRLSAPRRYGKTSLLYRVRDDARAAGMRCVYVDLWGTVSLIDLAETIEEAYRKELKGPIRNAAVAVIRSLRPTLKATPGGIGAELSPDASAEPTRRIRGLLDLPLKLHERDGRRTVVIFDEFQELLRSGNELDAVLRSRIQHHGTAAGYIYAGSHPGLMEELFGRKERPLFGQAQPLYLDPLSDADLADYIARRFEETGRDPGEALDRLLDFVGGHPQRAMMLTHHLWRVTQQQARAQLEDFDGALSAVRAEAHEALEAVWSSLGSIERRVISALARSDDPLLSDRTLTRFQLAKTSAREARDRLIAAGDLQRLGDETVIVDPLLADYARRRAS
jgi:uncharacterized protein